MRRGPVKLRAEQYWVGGAGGQEGAGRGRRPFLPGGVGEHSAVYTCSAAVPPARPGGVPRQTALWTHSRQRPRSRGSARCLGLGVDHVRKRLLAPGPHPHPRDQAAPHAVAAHDTGGARTAVGSECTPGAGAGAFAQHRTPLLIGAQADDGRGIKGRPSAAHYPNARARPASPPGPTSRPNRTTPPETPGRAPGRVRPRCHPQRRCRT